MFNKDIESYIDIESFSATRDYWTLDANGANVIEFREFALERPINGEGITIQGFEINYQQDLGYGFGLSRGLIGYKGDFGQLDFNASYNLTDDIEVLFQAINLGDEETVWHASRENHTPDPGRPIGVYNHGRRYAIGMNVKF